MSESANEYQVGGEHYQRMPIEPWTVMEMVLSREEFIGFLKGNIIKYSMRAGHKVGAHSDEDVSKALHYADKLEEVRSNDG